MTACYRYIFSLLLVLLITLQPIHWPACDTGYVGQSISTLAHSHMLD